MPSDLSRVEVKEEGNLLIEAVALLVQRQRESEGWIAEQIWQAEERAAAAERRYAELEVRLVGIEQNLARLTHDVEPAPGDAAVEERLARLREQVEGLKSGSEGRTGGEGRIGSEGRTARPAAVTDLPPGPGPAPVVEAREPEPERVVVRPSRPEEARVERPTVVSTERESPAPHERESPAPPQRQAPAPAERQPAVTATSARVAVASQGPSFWDLFGATPADRAGLALIGGGLVFVLYALLTQLHLS